MAGYLEHVHAVHLLCGIIVSCLITWLHTYYTQPRNLPCVISNSYQANTGDIYHVLYALTVYIL